MGLQQKHQQLTANALIGAAERGLITHGLDVTIEEIAALAGVGRRTVFRHFATRDELLDCALDAGLAAGVDVLPEYHGGDWLPWLADVALAWHTGCATWRRAIWDLRTRPLPPRLVRHRDEPRRQLAGFVQKLWEAAGGEGPAPDSLACVFAIHMSPLFMQIVLLEVEGTPELAAELATTAIGATLREMLGQ
jgi:AcrR family transcriptional regulator